MRLWFCGDKGEPPDSACLWLDFYDAGDEDKDRLMKIFDELDGLIKEYHPDVMGVEKLFFNRNVTTAIPVGQARGVVLLAAAKRMACVS